MAKNNYDGIIEAVRYTPDSQVDIVRIYERRGPTYSDRILLTRQQLIDRLEKGQQFVAGQRMPQMASTFDITAPVRLSSASGGKLLYSSDQQSGETDNLQNTPLF